MRGCLFVLVLAAALVAAIAWFGRPRSSPAVISGALQAAGYQSASTTITATADPPPRLLLGHADRVAIDASDVAWKALRARHLALTLDGVDLFARTADTVHGTIEGAEIADGRGGTAAASSIELAGPGRRRGGHDHGRPGDGRGARPGRRPAAVRGHGHVRRPRRAGPPPDRDARPDGGGVARDRPTMARWPSRRRSATAPIVRIDPSLPLQLTDGGGRARRLRLVGRLDVSGLLGGLRRGRTPDRAGRRTPGCILRPMAQPGTTPDDRKASARGAARAVAAEAGSAVPTTHAAKRRAKAETARQADRPAPHERARPPPRRSRSRTSPRSRASSRDRPRSTTRRPTSSRRARRSTSPSRPTPASCGRRASRTSPTRSPRPRSSPSSASTRSRSRPRSSTTSPRTPSTACQDIEERFGPEVAQLVDGVTKLSKFSTHSHEQQQAENIRKMFLAMAEDIRVVLIKLADRLHNMRTLVALPSEKQQRIARQTMEIYAPLAERLGIWQIKWELEDLAFKVLEPERVPRARQAARHAAQGPRGLHRAGDRGARAARSSDGRHRGRPPGPARSTSTASARRCSARAPSSARSTTSTRSACSSTRSATATRRSASSTRCGGRSRASSTTTSRSPRTTSTSRSTPRSSRSTASRSRSRSGPTRCTRCQRGRHRRPLALQGRLEGRPRVRRQARLAAPAHGLAARRHVDATEFVEGIKLDIFQDQVFVFTPKGDIKDLPAGATPLDFAYRIHTDVGHRTIGAKVNNRLVPLDYRLKNGDIVEIVTTKGEHGPSRDWLNIVRTSHAREKIRQWFKRKDRDENIVHGRESLERELRRLARTSHPGGRPRQDRRGRQAATTTTRSTTSTRRSATARSAPSRSSSRLGVVDDARGRRCRRSRRRRSPARTGGVRVKGVGDLLVRFAKCCHPIPGDPIVGLHHPRQGRHGPPPSRARRSSTSARSPRLIEVEWEAAPAQTYPIAIRVEAYDRTGPAHRHHPGRGREQGQHPGRGRRREPGPHGDRRPRRSRSPRSRSWPRS